MAETMTATPLRVRRLATKPMRNTFMLRSSLEKPRPLERLVRTMSPSRTSTLSPLSLSSCSTISATVVLPAPERPVNHRVKPRWFCISFSIPAPFCLVSAAMCRFVVYIPHAASPRERFGRGLCPRPDALRDLLDALLLRFEDRLALAADSGDGEVEARDPRHQDARVDDHVQLGVEPDGPEEGVGVDEQDEPAYRRPEHTGVEVAHDPGGDR